MGKTLKNIKDMTPGDHGRIHTILLDTHLLIKDATKPRGGDATDQPGDDSDEMLDRIMENLKTLQEEAEKASKGSFVTATGEETESIECSVCKVSPLLRLCKTRAEIAKHCIMVIMVHCDLEVDSMEAIINEHKQTASFVGLLATAIADAKH